MYVCSTFLDWSYFCGEFCSLKAFIKINWTKSEWANIVYSLKQQPQKLSVTNSVNWIARLFCLFLVLFIFLHGLILPNQTIHLLDSTVRCSFTHCSYTWMKPLSHCRWPNKNLSITIVKVNSVTWIWCVWVFFLFQ